MRITQVVLNRSEFIHFLNGDGTFFFNLDSFWLIPKEEKEELESIKEAENTIFASYNDFAAYLQFNNQTTDLTYEEIDDIVVMAFAED